ncbi:MAG: hypothetical protein FJ398_14045 [Verrucomicrobia bacterium]|nr:hypothetical protein [Verrucomicrobiota bacterium]
MERIAGHWQETSGPEVGMRLSYGTVRFRCLHRLSVTRRKSSFIHFCVGWGGLYRKAQFAVGICLWLLSTSQAQPASPGQAAPPQFSVARGFYESPFSLSISSRTPGAVVYYCSDFSEPAPGQSPPATRPVQIGGTTVIRARAFKEGLAPSDIVTHTYLFLGDVIHQAPDGKPPTHFPSSWGANEVDYGMDPKVISRYTAAEWREALTQIPSISAVTEVKNLFDPATGIYANAAQRGQAWERPASIELLDSKKVPQGQFQENCGLRIRGGYSRNPQYAKHAFRVFFRREYGAAKLKFPWFDGEGASEFDTFDLRTSQNYSWAIDAAAGRFDTMVQDVFCRETLGALGQPTTRSRYYHLFLNGQYWGLYETQERPEEAYGETYFGGRKEDYDVVKSANHPGVFVTEAADGNLDAFRALWTLARSVATNAANSNYFAVLGRNADGSREPARPVLLDVDNLIDYMLVIFYTGDGDAPLSWFLNFERSNNWFGLRDRTNPNVGFRFFNHDAEHTLGAPFSQIDRTGPYVRPNQNNFTFANPQWIHQDLAASGEYRLRFADHVQRHFFHGGALTPEAATQRFLRKAAQIDHAIRAYSARWGDAVRQPAYGEAEWRNTIDWIVTHWFPARTSVVLEQLKRAGLYPLVSAPEMRFESDAPAQPLLRLSHANATGRIYFAVDGTDPRVVGGAVAPGAMVYTAPVSVSTTDRVLARVRDGSSWSAVVEAQLPGLSNSPHLTIRRTSSAVALDFSAAAMQTYTLEYRDDVAGASWRALTNFPPAAADRRLSVQDTLASPLRFYRLRASP